MLVLGVSENINICPKVGLLIIGSEEAFSCTQPENTVGFSMQVFEKNNNPNKLVSYATSFGYTSIDRLKKFYVER